MNCKACNKVITGKPYSGCTCQGCYRYFKNGGKINELPEAGTIVKDDRGYPICHICGRGYKRLGSHCKESHNMTINEYKEMFGICNRTRTTEASYSEMMKCNALNHHMDKILMEAGMNTRFKAGDKVRLGKETRLQEKRSKARKEKDS